jgi:hypothetical protein
LPSGLPSAPGAAFSNPGMSLKVEFDSNAR